MGYNYDSIGALLMYSLLLGFALGFVYDFFRAIRLFFSGESRKCPLVVTCICDILFCVCAAVICSIFIFVFNNGRIRITALFFSLCGLIIYLYTLGKIMLGLNSFLFGVLKKLYKLIVLTVFGSICRFFWRIICKTLLTVKKFFDYLFTRREMFRIIRTVRKL